MPKRLEPDEIKRRDFLGIAGFVSAGVASIGSLFGMMRLPKPRVLDEVSSRFRIGRPQDFPVGSETIIAERNVKIISSEKGIAAMSLICTHLGCIVDATEDGFSCPCHGSQFAADGRPISGPAPRALAWLAISQTADGTLIVDNDTEVAPEKFYQA